MPINNCQYTLLVITSSFRDPEKILKTLREADFMLLEASNQQEAIQRIRTTSPDLILLDIDKSVRQENTILQDFKTNKITGAIPVLFITSMTSENHIPECLNYDNIDFITKPFRPQELVIRVQHQLSLLRAERVIRRQNEKLKKSLEARDKLYSIIAHDLRAPIGTIKMINSSIEAQKAKIKDPQISKLFEMINETTEEAFNLLENLLRWTRNQNGKTKIYATLFNLTPVARQVVSLFSAIANAKEIELINRIEGKFDIFADEDMIKTVLRNLISNAIKYTEQGKITLSLYPTTRNGVTYTEIKVSDTGYGISAEALPHVFDRYYQESGKHQASGTGIGLALVRNLVELHEGEIRVESIQNEGSTFYISLLTDNIYPNALHGDSTKQTEEEMISEAVPEDSQNTEPETSKPILLIVEDNEDIQKYIAESFSDSFEVITGSNGEEGKQQALNRIPDIIVSDIMMPVMDGITLCRQLKEDVRTSHIPVILLTAKDSLQDKEEGYEVGADSYLTKPFSASLLRSRINNLLDSRKKLIAQFQQTGTSHNPNSHLDEKRSIITEALSKLDNEFIEKITQLVEDNLSSEKIDITYLSDKMCMSGSTLYRKMKALTGLSTNEYIRKVKMQNTERILLEGKYNISEIAYKIGMNSTGYFRQCFKDEFGVSPSDYLKQFTSPTPPPSS